MSVLQETQLTTVKGKTYQTNWYPDRLEIFEVRAIRSLEHPFGYRLCRRCDNYEPQSAYSKDLSMPDGLRFYCKNCCKQMKQKTGRPKSRPEDPAKVMARRAIQRLQERRAAREAGE
jgi:transposase-like protein